VSFRAHVRAAADPLARAWLAAPTNYPFDALHVECALRTRLGLPVLASRHSCGCRACRARRVDLGVGSIADVVARACVRGPAGATTRHNIIADTLHAWLTTHGVHALREPADAASVAAPNTRPADIGLYLGWRRVALDVTRVELLGADERIRTRMAGAGGTDAYSQRRAEKNSRYDLEDLLRRNWEYQVLPVGSPHGDTDAAGHRLLHRLAQQASRVNLPASLLLPNLQTTLSLAAMRGIVERYDAARGYQIPAAVPDLRFARVPSAARAPPPHGGGAACV
jgi:hypothetical protein